MVVEVGVGGYFGDGRHVGGRMRWRGKIADEGEGDVDIDCFWFFSTACSGAQSSSISDMLVFE